jgi:hypothetical protein
MGVQVGVYERREETWCKVANSDDGEGEATRSTSTEYRTRKATSTKWNTEKNDDWTKELPKSAMRALNSSFFNIYRYDRVQW